MLLYRFRYLELAGSCNNLRQLLSVGGLLVRPTVAFVVGTRWTLLHTLQQLCLRLLGLGLMKGYGVGVMCWGDHE